MSIQDSWIKDIELDVEKFATEHRVVLGTFSKLPSALFEIGALHLIARFYAGRRGTKVTPENLQEDGYKYLTTPSGNPKNFSYIKVQHAGGNFEIRQQVRVRNWHSPEIMFTPDMVVIPEGAEIGDVRTPD